MNLEKTVTVLCTDKGAAQSLIPVIRAIKSPVTVFVDSTGKAVDAFKKSNVPFTAIGKEDKLRLDGDILLTGTTPPKYKDGPLSHYGREAEAWRLAREQGKPSFALLDKYTRSESRGRFTEQPAGEQLQFPDIIFSPHEYATQSTKRDFKAEYSFKNTCMIETGDPAFDDILARKQRARRPPQYEGREGRMIPIFLSSQDFMKENGMDNCELLEIVCGAARIDSYLVVKAHPKDTNEYAEYRKILMKHLKGSISDCDSEELALSLQDNEFCIGTSGRLIETATLADKLALSIKPGWKGEDDVITNLVGATPYAYTAQDAANLIQKALASKEFRDKWASKRADYTTDGQSTARVLDFIRGI